MAANYTTLQVQTGAELRILRKLQAQIEHARDADNANFHRRLLSVANGYSDSDDEESRAKANAISHFDAAMLSSLRSVLTAYRNVVQDVDRGYFHVLASEIGASKADRDAGAISYTYESINGKISIASRNGVLGRQHRQMETDRQIVRANQVTVGSLTPQSSNRGKLTAVTLRGASHTLSGTVTLAVRSQTVSAVTLSIQNTLTKPLHDVSGTSASVVPADRVNTVEKESVDGPTGLTIEVQRPGLAAPVESGDSGNVFSSVSFSNPQPGDGDVGIFFLRVTRNAAAPDFTIRFYSDAARETEVGSEDVTGTSGSEVFTTRLTNGTQITYTFNKANAATEMPSTDNTTDASYDIESPRVGDEWTFTVVNDRAGEYASKYMDTWRFSPPAGIASGAAATAALAGAGAGNVDDGTHSYRVSFVHPDGESAGGTKSNVVTVADKGVDGQVDLTSVPLGPTGTTARRVYRTVAGDTGRHKFVGEIGDNTTTMFNDNVADANLGEDANQEWDEANATAISMS